MNIAKNTLSFSCSKKMLYLRTPPDIWNVLTDEFNFTLDACASDENHLVEKYYTKEDSCLNHSWEGEIVYLHPLFDSRIGKFITYASQQKNCLIIMLLPAGTHTKYFHEHLYKKENVEIRFLRKPKKGFHFGCDDGTPDDENEIGYIKPLMIVVMNN